MTAKQLRLLKRDLVGWSFCIVPIVIFIIFIVVPLVMAFYISLTEYNLNNMEFIGFKNYVNLFTKPALREDLLISFKNVLVYTVMVIPLSLVVNLGVAAILQNIRGGKIYRVIFYLPGLTSSVVMSIIWSWFFNVAYSPINSLMGILGLPEFTFLSSPDTAMPTLVLMIIWTGIGGGIVMYSAAMQTIPGELYEAAKIDGAGAFVQFVRITLPMIRPTIFFTCTMSLIGSLQLFDPVY
ncbi:MAG: carbohydrate ABC transporter permease, partial [Christensenellales bacterium]